MPVSEDALTQYSVWYHPKGGGVYLVTGVSTSSTNGDHQEGQRVVHYLSFKYREPRHREISQFLDGRFVPLDVQALVDAVNKLREEVK